MVWRDPTIVVFVVGVAKLAPSWTTCKPVGDEANVVCTVLGRRITDFVADWPAASVAVSSNVVARRRRRRAAAAARREPRRRGGFTSSI